MSVFIILLASYLLGSIPFSYLLPKVLTKQDIRKVGSKNVGATNVYRMNKKLAILVLILDVTKAALPIVYVDYMGYCTRTELYAMGMLSIIGHVFPVWLKLKGGKGVATTVGTILALSVPLSAAFLLTFIATFYKTRYVSLSSITAVIATVITCAMTESKSATVTFIITGIIVICKHKENIERLLKNEEKKL